MVSLGTYVIYFVRFQADRVSSAHQQTLRDKGNYALFLGEELQEDFLVASHAMDVLAQPERRSVVWFRTQEQREDALRELRTRPAGDSAKDPAPFALTVPYRR